MTAACDTTASGGPSAMILPASMQTRRFTTCMSTWTMCSIQSTARPAFLSPATVSTRAADSASVRPAPISSSRSTTGSTARALANLDRGERRRAFSHGPELSGGIRLQRARDRDVGVGRVLADHEVDRPLRDALLPLAADDRRGLHVRDRSPGKRGRLCPVEVADDRVHRKRLDGVRDLGLVLRIAACFQHRFGDVEQRETRSQLLVPLLAARALVAVRELLARDACERGLVRPGRMPVHARRETVADRA